MAARGQQGRLAPRRVKPGRAGSTGRRGERGSRTWRPRGPALPCPPFRGSEGLDPGLDSPARPAHQNGPSRPGRGSAPADAPCTPCSLRAAKTPPGDAQQTRSGPTRHPATHVTRSMGWRGPETGRSIHHRAHLPCALASSPRARRRCARNRTAASSPRELIVTFPFHFWAVRTVRHDTRPLDDPPRASRNSRPLRRSAGGAAPRSPDRTRKDASRRLDRHR